MPGLFSAPLLAAMALACIGSPAIGQSRPLAVDDIVRLEAFGRAALSPDGHWLIYEKRGAYDAAPRFDYGPRSTWAIMDLWLVDLRQSNPSQRLLPDEPPGLLRGSWSPSATGSSFIDSVTIGFGSRGGHDGGPVLALDRSHTRDAIDGGGV